MMKEKKIFSRMILLSIIFHFSVFAFFVLLSGESHSESSVPVYYVSLIESSTGGGGGASFQKLPEGSMKELTVKKEEPTKSSLRYPVEKPKKEPKKTKTVIQKPDRKKKVKKDEQISTYDVSKGELSTGISSGVRSGSGSGYGEGEGFGIPGFPYAYYVEIIRDKISSNWFKSLVSPGVSGYFKTTIFFKILKDGQISDLKVEEPSGIQSLDLSALRAVKSSIPFPPLPKDYSGNFLGIHFQFEYIK
ncbi:MAG: energy transducer TonB [Acidobacteriota bacterium]